MAGRQIGTAVAAAVYGVVHHVVVAGEIAKGAGWKHLPGPMQAIVEVCFICLVAMAMAFLIPRILRFNIAVSRALLASLAWCDGIVNRALDRLRRGMISAAERTASWLRGEGRDRDPPDSDRSEPMEA